MDIAYWRKQRNRSQSATYERISCIATRMARGLLLVCTTCLSPGGMNQHSTSGLVHSTPNHAQTEPKKQQANATHRDSYSDRRGPLPLRHTAHDVALRGVVVAGAAAGCAVALGWATIGPYDRLK